MTNTIQFLGRTWREQDNGLYYWRDLQLDPAISLLTDRNQYVELSCPRLGEIDDFSIWCRGKTRAEALRDLERRIKRIGGLIR